MASITCKNPDCTIATTGKCLLSIPNPEDCQHFQFGDEDEGDETPESVATAPESDSEEEEPKQGRQFHLGIELGSMDAAEIMRARYTHVIGVLGLSDAGKTCFLCSLYLLASGGLLPKRYEFSGCRTFQAFEDRARGLRKWDKSKLPTQLVDHTVLADPRQASFLHLGLRETEGERKRYDLLLTDLPGEWTDNLAKKASYAPTFQFLQRADGIVLALDGKLLIGDERHVELQRMRYFVQRLADNVKLDREIPIVILICKADEIEMEEPEAAVELREYAKSFGFPATSLVTAAFSREPQKVASGTGVFEAINVILSHDDAQDYASQIPIPELNARTFRGFKG